VTRCGTGSGASDGEPRVLLHEHARLGRWLPPGGHIEPSELPDEAAVREVLEETSLTVELVGDQIEIPVPARRGPPADPAGRGSARRDRPEPRARRPRLPGPGRARSRAHHRPVGRRRGAGRPRAEPDRRGARVVRPCARSHRGGRVARRPTCTPDDGQITGADWTRWYTDPLPRALQRPSSLQPGAFSPGRPLRSSSSVAGLSGSIDVLAIGERPWSPAASALSALARRGTWTSRLPALLKRFSETLTAGSKAATVRSARGQAPAQGRHVVRCRSPSLREQGTTDRAATGNPLDRRVGQPAVRSSGRCGGRRSAGSPPRHGGRIERVRRRAAEGTGPSPTPMRRRPTAR
jgi:hypothetical protein